VKKRVQVIEDNPVVASVYRTKLTLEGFEVDVANDGEAGVARAIAFTPNVILLDLMLPKLGGLEVLGRIREHAALANVPVIVFSNSLTKARLEEVWSAGARQVIEKASSTPKQVVELVRSLLVTNE
jgi:CheY-like chemotaxis protein